MPYVKHNMNLILATLQILQACDYNYREAARKTKINRLTIKEWSKKYANLLPPIKAVASPIKAMVDKFVSESTDKIIDNLITEQIPEGKISFSDLADGLRIKMLNRIEELVKDSKDVEKVARSMKIVHDIKKELDEGTGNGIMRHKQGNTNFIQIITDQLKLIKNESDSDST